MRLQKSIEYDSMHLYRLCKENYQLTHNEVVDNILLFMAAGYETTSSALAYATYELAIDVLQKLQAEIDQLPLSSDDNDDNKKKKHPDYDIVAQMHYMDMFVSEVFKNVLNCD